MTADRATLAVYERDAAGYADFAGEGYGLDRLDRFIAMIPEDGHVLDLGAGPGWGAARIAAAGRRVLAQDASPALLAEAERRHGVRIRVAMFSELADEAAFEGIWASFSLLHVPKSETPDNLARCFRALKPGGVLYVGLKHGEGEERDRLGRLYVYYSEDELRALLAGAGFEAIEMELGAVETGYDGAPSRGLHAFARRPL
jgi:SAM-dependent methyltransferase